MRQLHAEFGEDYYTGEEPVLFIKRCRYCKMLRRTVLSLSLERISSWEVTSLGEYEKHERFELLSLIQSEVSDNFKTTGAIRFGNTDSPV
jgi:hypothetical protein